MFFFARIEHIRNAHFNVICRNVDNSLFVRQIIQPETNSRQSPLKQVLRLREWSEESEPRSKVRPNNTNDRERRTNEQTDKEKERERERTYRKKVKPKPMH